MMQVFQIDLIFISLCKEEAVQLSGLNLGGVQERTRNGISTSLP